MMSYFLRLIHYVIALGEFLHHLIFRVPFHATFAFSKQTVSSIQNDSRLLRKLPSHIGIIVAEDTFSFKDIANLIVWGISLGISYITVYDMNGEIKRNDAVLQQCLKTSKEQIMCNDQSSYDIQLFPSFKTKVEKDANSSGRSHKASVHLVCMDDGHRQIVNMTQQVSRMVKSGACNIDDIVPSTVDKLLQDSTQFPDPELCIKFGSTDCLFGYLPWQIRLTEIINLPSHKNIGYKCFLSSLLQYANTSQRFGK